LNHQDNYVERLNVDYKKLNILAISLNFSKTFFLHIHEFSSVKDFIKDF